jgi:hypothetical protein
LPSPIRVLFFLLSLAAPAQTVYLFSLDGLGHQLLTKSPVTAPLKTLRRLAARGAMADGMQPAFPSATGNSHAALWTGVYGDVSNITSNSQPYLPRAAHTFLERNNGYRSDQLAAEPLWIAAARQGLKSVAYQAPQVFPFRPFTTHPNATLVNGYQSRQVAGHTILRRQDLVFDSPTAFHFKHGPLTLRGTLTPTGLTIENTPVRLAPVETKPPLQRPLARHFSDGLYLADPVPAVVYFRLFEFTATDLLLYVSPIQELAISQGDATAMLRESGGFIGNTHFGPKLSTSQSLEVMELLTRQNARQTLWLAQHLRPALFIGYIPICDELGHQFLGLHEQGDADATRAMLWGFTIAERWFQLVTPLVTKKDHLVITADHGMAPISKLVNVNEALRRAGLGKAATHVYNSVLINTTDWKGGTVQNRDAVRALVRKTLEETGVFTAFFTPEEHGKNYGIGGPAGSDLYFDLKPGYGVRDTVGELFPPLEKPIGSHGFVSDRPDMLATLIVASPRIGKATKWPRLKSIDVAPLAAKLLGIEPPKQARGRSPL